MGYKFYNYNPSGAAAVAFAAVFGLTTVVHLWQMIRSRTWYFIPFIIGAICTSLRYHTILSPLTCLAGYS